MAEIYIISDFQKKMKGRKLEGELIYKKFSLLQRLINGRFIKII